MKYITALLLLVNLFGTNIVNAQKERFSIGGILGMNFALLPYEKPINNNEQKIPNNGLNAGIFCNAILNTYFNAKIEILYSVNGSYINPASSPKLEFGKIKLRHIELPLHIDFYVNRFKSTGFLPDWSFEFGAAYVYMFNYYVEDSNGNNIVEQIDYNNTNALLLQVGTTIFFTKHFGGNLRFSKSMLPLQNNLSLTSSIRLIYRL